MTNDTQKVRILMVDDDEALLLLVGMYLKKVGYSPLSYRSGTEAISAIREGLEYKIALIDLTLGPGDVYGAKVADASKEVNPSVPVLIMSGMDDLDIPRVDSYIKKPAWMPDLVKKINEYVPGAKA